ncbi:MAG: hypothetical protein C0408_05295 [Odoribacter sp.]|nr:hypothetical protein [Odoribacter sp.]
MRTRSRKIINRVSMLFLLITLVVSGRLSGQNISFGIFADPVISWFSTNIKEVKNDGARAGFNFGFTFNRYFSDNYAFSTGISILNAGGRLAGTDTTNMKFNNLSAKVSPGQTVVYKIQYLSIPLGLKFKSNQIGYITFFTDIGIDPKFVIGGKADIPYLDIEGEAAMNELRGFNLSYHVMAGIEYSLGGSTAMVFGLGFDNNFMDVTKDILDQPADKVTHKILKFRIGVNF